MAKDSVIPSEAARSGADYSALGGAVEGPFLLKQQERSLHYASLRSAPVGMTGYFTVSERRSVVSSFTHAKMMTLALVP